MKPFSWEDPSLGRIVLVEDMWPTPRFPFPEPLMLIDQALDAGLLDEADAAIAALDALEGDEGLEAEELDGDPPYGDLTVYAVCDLGHEHAVDKLVIL